MLMTNGSLMLLGSDGFRLFDVAKCVKSMEMEM